jgi:uncharacterized protein YqfA (UPF0365 family)
MEQVLIIAAVLLGVILLCIFFVRCLLPWTEARFGGVRVGLGTVISMSLRRAFPRRILAAAILAKKGEVEAPLGELESHAAAGGNPSHVVLGLIAAKETGLQITFQELCDVDRRGEDVLAFLRKRAGG